jgi:DNA polymerase-3 subunit chi
MPSALARMTEVLFYHLTESTLEEALPGLLEKSVQRGWRAVVQTGTEERRDALDAHLWTFRDDSFLAHGTDREPHAAEQPVLLTTEAENGNGAEIRFIVDGATPPDVAAYERAVFMFDGHDAAQLETAREHWKAMKAGGHAVTYWQQTPERRWERKA